jgi:hypothetical protein
MSFASSGTKANNHRRGSRERGVKAAASEAPTENRQNWEWGQGWIWSTTFVDGTVRSKGKHDSRICFQRQQQAIERRAHSQEFVGRRTAEKPRRSGPHTDGATRVNRSRIAIACSGGSFGMIFLFVLVSSGPRTPALPLTFVAHNHNSRHARSSIGESEGETHSTAQQSVALRLLTASSSCRRRRPPWRRTCSCRRRWRRRRGARR